MGRLTRWFFAALICAFGSSAHADLVVDPGVGLTDFIFNFSGPGDSVTWSGQDKLSVHVGVSLMSFKLHAEDCCVPGDVWELVIDGTVYLWDVTQEGDGNPNGGAFLGASNPGSGYFEGLKMIVLGAGDHTIDMTQIAGIPGGAYFNMSSGKSLPVPGTLLLVGAALVALGVKRQRLA